MKIKVGVELKPNLFVPEKESVKKWVLAMKVRKIHTRRGMIGFDEDIEGVIMNIEKARQIGIHLDDFMNHTLLLIINNKKIAYDIGKITIDDLNISK